MDTVLLGSLGFEASSASASGPDPQQSGLWRSVFGNQPYGAAQPFSMGATSATSMPPYAAHPGSSNPVPPATSYSNAAHVSHVQQPQRHLSGQSSNDEFNASTGKHSNSTSPEPAVGKSDAPIKDMPNPEKPKKTRKRQQTSCSECHRRKQKCNQQVPCDRCIKRGTSDACRVILAGEAGYQDVEREEERESPPNAAKRKRKRKNEGGGEGDLVARVQQLENIIRMTQVQQQNGSSSTQNSFPSMSTGTTGEISPLASLRHGHERLTKEDTADSPSEAAFSVKSETSAVEEAAVAALGQLSKAKPNEGGDEARIYSGPGSVNAFLSASVFGKTAHPESRYRARAADLYHYSGVPAIHNLATSTGPRMTRLVDALAEQKAKLPPAAVCHYLWNFYYSCPLLSGRHRNFPRACIQGAYDALWDKAEDKDMSDDAQAARAKNFPQLASEHSLAFLSLCFVTFAISLSLAPGASPESAAVSSIMYEASRSALMASEQREQPTYSVMSALFNQTMWLKLAGCPSLGFTYVAQAIRFGQSMGLHREPGPKWGLGAFEAEIRRRIWWSLVVGDKGHSIAYGRPYSIFDRHCDVDLPANIHEKDLTPDGPTNIRPLSEITEQTGTLISIRMSHVIAEIIDRALSCKAPSYNTILDLDNLLTKTESECIPDGFRNPSLSDLAEKPYLRGAYTEVQIQLCWLRSILHRPYLLQKLPKPGEADHYAGSRALTVMLSQKMLGMNKDQLNHTPENLKSYFGFAFNCFEPAVNLAMAIIQAPGSPNASILDQYVCEAIEMLDKMKHVNKVAVEGHESLQFIREKYLSAIEEATAPSTATSAFGPSPVSLGYTSTSNGVSPQTNASSPKQQALPGTNPQQPETAPTPNTLFNQFFANLSDPSPVPNPNDQVMDPATTDIDKLFNIDPTLYSSDPNATWLTQPIDGGLECWPLGMPRLEGETDFGDWAKMLGF